MNLSEQTHNFLTITIVRRFHIWLSLMIAMSFCVGCTDDFEPIIPITGDRIEFSATVGGEWETRASTRSNTDISELPRDTVYSMISDTGNGELYLHTRSDFNRSNPFNESISNKSRGSMMTLNEYGLFGLLAGIYENEWKEEDCNANYIYNVECKNTSGNNYAPTNSYYWPGLGQKIRFWGYAPYNYSSIKLSSLDSKGSPTITYTVPDKNEDQVDLITVMADGTKSGVGTQNLIFNHVLTAIQFVTADDIREGSIKSISINGVYSKATARIGSSDWYDYSETKDFSLEFYPQVAIEENNNHELAVGKNTFLMIPQSIPDGAEIVVEFVDITNTTRKLRASIANNQWVAGTVVTYHITTQSILYTPIISLNEKSYIFPFSACAQSKDFTFASYSEVSQVGANSTYRLEPFEFEILDEKGQPILLSEGAEPYVSANLLTTFPLDGDNISTSIPSSLNRLSVGIKSTNMGIIVDENDKLQTTNTLRETPTPPETNLAMTKTGISTANCYMVHAPGTYKFPIVYGNAINNGGNNESAYQIDSELKGNNYSNYVNYKGHLISSPYIKNDLDVSSSGLNIGTAELVWQDVKGLIQSIDNDDDYISFTITKESIREGNAVIALKDNDGLIVWSWHIWVTTYNPDLDDVIVSNENGNSIKLMTSYIGYCHPFNRYYPEKNVLVRIKQTRTGKYEDITIKLQGIKVTDVGNSVYFQYGRKDPFPGQIVGFSDVSGHSLRRATVKSIYDYGGNEISRPCITNKMRYSIQQSIQNPDKQAVYTGNSTKWYTGSYVLRNLWTNLSTISNTETVVKTIYDPSPNGYSIPSPTVANVIESSPASVNENDGIDFSYTVTLDNGNAIYFPWTLELNYGGYYYYVSTNPYKVENMAVWGSTYYGNPVFMPSKSGMQAFTNYGCVALPVMPMRQN